MTSATHSGSSRPHNSRTALAFICALSGGSMLLACQPRTPPAVPAPEGPGGPQTPAEAPKVEGVIDPLSLISREVLLNPKMVITSAEQVQTYNEDAGEVWVALVEVPKEEKLNALIRQDARQTGDSFMVEARSAMKEAAEGAFPAQPWSMQIDWSVAAQSEQLVGVMRSVANYSGGAHGSYAEAGLIFPRGSDVALQAPELFVDEVLPSIVAMAVCRGLAEQKIDRTGESLMYDEPMTCTSEQAAEIMKSATIGLLSSDQPDRVGGLVAFFDQYTVGPYAEGNYAIPVAQEAFAANLKLEWAESFAGKPVVNPVE